MSFSFWNKYTVGGQYVGRLPLKCESKGSSDYCMHCGCYMVTVGPCLVLERLRLQQIPDNLVAAFGCSLKALDPDEGKPCEKWCHNDTCVYSLKPEASK